MTEKLTELCRMRDSLVIFRSLGKDKVISNLMYLIGSDTEKIENFLTDYSDFTEALYRNGVNLSEYLLKAVLESENMYIQQTASGKTPDPLLQECLIHELMFFQELSRLTPEDFTEGLDYDGFLPKWYTSEIDFVGSYSERIRMINKYGYGQFARYNVFTVNNGSVIPVEYPDKQRLSELYGYERERNAVINNTLALLDGKPAQNVLLYGDAGTGKSSTVKAIANEYASQGLRLIEITKEQLRDLPQIIDKISRNPLKFILFIDDLSFASGEDCFGALKATLEGSVSARADNIAIYATSNRRHLVKESFSDREGDDIHRNDTIQEMISLSARFGLTVGFYKPDKKAYISIVKALAEKNGITMDEDALSVQAEAFALRGSGRSARTAKQFVRQLVNEKK
ncbi:MAG: ATP-binding protein [Ruminococcus sp.]|nr:ATP-binding protein [Ruminococcus sp.]